MKDSEKKYKKIDPWKLIEDTFHLDNYIDLSVKILSWPFSLFEADTPPFAKNDTKIKVTKLNRSKNSLEFDYLKSIFASNKIAPFGRDIDRKWMVLN